MTLCENRWSGKANESHRGMESKENETVIEMIPPIRASESLFSALVSTVESPLERR